MNDSFGAWLKRQRLEKGMTQAQVGEKLGTSHTIVQRYENDLRYVNFDVMLQLAEALGVPKAVATEAWVLANGGELSPRPGTTYAPDPALEEALERYSGLSDERREIARDAFIATIDALFRQIRRGAVGFGEDRYEEGQRERDRQAVREITLEDAEREYGDPADN